MIAYSELPDWIKGLEGEDLEFLKRFALSSGSLKSLAEEYGLSYPTIRLRMNKLIEKIKQGDTRGEDEYVQKVKAMALDGDFSLETAKELIKTYRRIKENGN